MSFFNNLISFRLDNFCSIKNMILTIQNQRLTHIVGVNNDDDLSPSNGSGKSTIKSGLCWNLFGQTETGRQADSILPWTEPKNCSTESVWANGKDLLTIRRYRAHKEKKNLVELFLNDQDITGKDNSDTQNLINNYIGFSYDLFCLLLTTGMTSKKMKDFMLMSDSEKKEFMGFLLDLSFLDQAQQTVKDRLKTVSTDLEGVVRQQTGNEAKLESAQQSLMENERRVETHAKQIEEQIAAKQVVIAGMETEAPAKRKVLENLRDQIKAIVIPPSPDLSVIDGKRKDIKGYLKHNDEQQVVKTKLSKELLALTASLGREVVVDESVPVLSKARGEIVAAERELTLLEASVFDSNSKEVQKQERQIICDQNQLDETKRKIADVERERQSQEKDCPTCGQCLNPEHLEKIDLERVIKIKDLSDTVMHLSTKITKSKVAIQEFISKGQTEFEKTKSTKMADLTSEIAQLRSIYEDLKAQELERLNKERNLDTIKTKIASVDSEIKMAESLIATNARYAAKLESEIALEEAYLREIQKKVLVLTDEKAILKSRFEIGKKDYEAFKQRIEAEKQNLIKLEAEKQENPYTQFVASAKAEIEKLNEQKESISKSAEDLKTKQEYLTFWKDGFGDKGIKSYVLDSVTELLEQKANFALSHITNGNVSIGFCTQKKNKSSDIVRDELNVEIFRDGQMVQFVDLSKGERCRISFAVNYALKALGIYYHGLKLNFEWYDEVLDGLDEIGCYQVIQFLRRELSNYESIFVVSHNENVKNLFDKNLVIEKTNGWSVLKHE